MGVAAYASNHWIYVTSFSWKTAVLGWYEVLPVSVECQFFSLHHSFNSACKTAWNCHLGWPQSWESCYQHQCNLLSPSSSTSTHLVFTDCGVCDTHSWLRDIPICNECWTEQSVWSIVPGSLTVTWLRWYSPSFTGFRYLCMSITNQHDDASSSKQYCSAVFGGTLTALQILQLPQCGSTASNELMISCYWLCSCGHQTLTEFIRSSYLLCCRSDKVELNTETFTWSCPHHRHRQLWTFIKYVFVYSEY